MKRNRMAAPLALALAIAAGGSGILSAQAVKVDPAIGSYKKTSGVSGGLSSVATSAAACPRTRPPRTIREFPAIPRAA